MSASAWEAIFMLVVLKIPLVYLSLVVWWAIRAEPTVAGGDEAGRSVVPLTPCGWPEWRRRRRPSRRPPVRPLRGPRRAARAPVAP